MKNIKFITLSVLFPLLLSLNLQAATLEYYVDGKKVKEIKDVVKGQRVKIVSTSKIKNPLIVAGKFGKASSPSKNGNSVTLEHVVDSSDVRTGYIIFESWFKRQDGYVDPKQGPYIDKGISTVVVTTPAKRHKRANESAEDELKRVLKELGIKEDKCKFNE
jgi:hypothetical protein